MAKVISDDEMAALEANQPKKVISDDEMAQMEAAPQSAAPYKSPGEGEGFLSDVKARITDPNRWKAIAGMDSPAKPDMVAGSPPPVALPTGAVAQGSSWIAKALGTDAPRQAVAKAPEAISKLANFLNASAPRRVAASAVQGAVTNPDDPLAGAAKSAAFSAGGETVAKLLKAPGDVAMQAGVGRRKYSPGVGTELADEGVWGTRGMMKGQVNKGLERTGSTLHELADEIPDAPINAPQMGRNIAQGAAKPMAVPGGAPSSADIPKIEKIREFGEDVASRGMETGPQALARRIAAGQRGYRGKEDPLQSLLGQLSKQEQIQYSQGLKGAHEAATSTSRFADTDRRYGALKRAQSSLNEDITIPRSLMGLLSQSAHAIPGGSLTLSTIGQAATKAGQAADKVNNPLLRQALLERASEPSEDEWLLQKLLEKAK